jgi:hypothetical protein
VSAPRRPDELIPFAIESLRRMQLPSGLFCLERVRGREEPLGESLRYSLMTLIGLSTAEKAGHAHGFDLEAIRSALVGRLDDPALKPGDYGLHLWADAVTGGNLGDDLTRRLERSLAGAGGPATREGMEVAWIVIGLARQGRPAGAALELLLTRNRSETGLFFHQGERGVRRRLPNFATQIYSVLALATAARAGLDDRALPAARACADRLLALQLADGGWPWLYDARTGRVVEPYEVYSVHQHAMAPMGLLALAEVSGDETYRAAAVHGLEWIHGRNELDLDMVDPGEGMVYRSIRRRRAWNRLALYGNTASTLTGLPRPFRGGLAELNATCRPYELGWLLEAWCRNEPASTAAQA